MLCAADNDRDMCRRPIVLRLRFSLGRFRADTSTRRSQMKFLLISALLLFSVSCSKKPITASEWVAANEKAKANGIVAIRNFGEPQAAVLYAKQWITVDRVENGTFSPNSPTGDFRIITYHGVPPNDSSMWGFRLYKDGHLTDDSGNPWKAKDP